MAQTSALLAEFADRMNRFGIYSNEANELLRDNQHDDEFLELAELSRQMLRKLGPKDEGTSTVFARLIPKGPRNSGSVALSPPEAGE